MKLTTNSFLLGLSALLFFSTATVNAQSFTIKAGLNIHSQLNKDDDVNFGLDIKSSFGYHLGIGKEIPLGSVFHLEPSLLFNTKGSRRVEEILNTTTTYKTQLYYLDLYLPLKYKVPLNDYDHFVFASAGAFFGYGLTGKNKVEVSGVGKTSTDVEWGTDEEEDFLKRPDYGVAFVLGAEISQWHLSIGYDLGIADISSLDANDHRIKNRLVRFSVGFVIP